MFDYLRNVRRRQEHGGGRVRGCWILLRGQYAYGADSQVYRAVQNQSGQI